MFSLAPGFRYMFDVNLRKFKFLRGVGGTSHHFNEMSKGVQKQGTGNAKKRDKATRIISDFYHPCSSLSLDLADLQCHWDTTSENEL